MIVLIVDTAAGGKRHRRKRGTGAVRFPMGSWVLAANACSSGTMRIRWNIELFRKEVLAHARMDEHLGVLRTTLVGYAAHYCSPLPPVNGVFPGYGGKYARGADECLEPDRRMRGLLVDECGFEGVYPSVWQSGNGGRLDTGQR